MAMQLAQKYNGEIICADSRTVYKGMDIGTAKPSIEDQQTVPHFGLNLVNPDTRFSAGQFKRYAENVIADIQARGKLPIMVGGSGLYVDSVLFDYQFSEPGAERDEQNPRHLKRTNPASTDHALRPNTLVIGLQVEKEVLHKRIEQRAASMLQNGLIDEVKDLLETWGADAPGALAPAYKAFIEYIEERHTLEEAKQRFIQKDKQLARRQVTWFARNKNIQWVAGDEQAEHKIAKFLEKFATIGT